MQRVNIYTDLLHLTGEWMNADMLNRGTEDRSLSLSLFLGGGGGGGGERSLRPLWIRQCYHDRGLLLIRKLLNQWFLGLQFKASFQKLYGHFHSDSMTCLTVKEYLCDKWPWICSVCHNNNLVLSSYMTYHRICNNSNMTGATSGAGTAYPSRALKFTLGF
jgi:hypothetical protein